MTKMENYPTFCIIFIFLIKEIVCNLHHLPIFQPMFLKSDLSNEVIQSLQKADESGTFLVGSSNLDYPCNNGSFYIFEGDGPMDMKGHVNPGCLERKRSWVFNSLKLSLILKKASYDVWVMLAKDQNQEGCNYEGKRVTLHAGAKEQFITSANFPNPYPGEVNCSWNITGHPNKTIHVTIYYMDIEVGPEGDCVFDKLIISNGSQKEELCGEHIWETETFYGTTLLIDFQTDKTGQHNGFLIGFQEEPTHDEL